MVMIVRMVMDIFLVLLAVTHVTVFGLSYDVVCTNIWKLSAFIHIFRVVVFVVNFVWMIVMLNGSLMVIVTFFIMPMLMSNSTGFEYSLQYNEEHNSPNENTCYYSTVCTLSFVSLTKNMDHCISK
jgi:hypothetical protein